MPTLLDRTEILKRLCRIAPDKIGIDPSHLKPNAVLADIGIDSFSLIELVFLAEEEFSIAIPLDGLAVKTVGDVLEIIERQAALREA
jgi:acyl carrier protein